VIGHVQREAPRDRAGSIQDRSPMTLARRSRWLLAALLGTMTCTGSEAAPMAAAVRKPGVAGKTTSSAAGIKSLPAAKPVPPIPLLTSLTVIPAEVSLTGPRAERQLLVNGRFSDGVERDVTDSVKYFSSAPRAVAVSAAGRVTALNDTGARVKVVAGGLTAWVKVGAKDTSRDVPRTFENDVVPVLTKAGCNMGACHGALNGKGGFRLSLLGFDPAADFASIAQENEGRRIVVTDPAESLILKKATMTVPHAGGIRFKADSYEYQVVLGWLKDGSAGPQPDAPEITGVEVLPAERTTHLAQPELKVAFPQAKGAPKPVALHQGQRLVALAKFRDGHVEDVTRKAQFNSLNDGVADAADDGQVTMAAKGATAVMVRYRGMATIARMIAPYRELPVQPAVARSNYVDALVAARWKQMGLLPSPRSTDAEFIRRVYLDVLATLPTPDEVRAFLASTDPEKRSKLIDAALDRPEYVDNWTLKWGDLLRNNSDKVQPKGMWSFYNWMRASFRENKPMDRFARELVTAQGSAYTTGPANYFRVASNPADLAETTSQVFLGVRLACAKCHHHPFEKWTQDDYWQMAAFFARVGLKGSQEFGIFGGEQVVRVNPSGEVANPRTGKVMKPKPLDGEPSDDPIDRRRALASWMTDPRNELFARNIVNRYWGYMMGRGIVEPVDDIRVTNPPSNPELLEALAKDFVTNGFDVKKLLRQILNSDTYQLSSNPTPDNKLDEVFYSKYAVKRMGAEELLDAVNAATGTTEKFPNLPAGMHAVQLPDPKVQNYFLDTFGRPLREIACECERSAEPNMAQALHLMNSDFVQNKVAAKTGRVGKLLEAKKPDDEIVQELYLATVSRPATPEEAARALQGVSLAPNKTEGFEDLLWALLNSREFMFKH